MVQIFKNERRKSNQSSARKPSQPDRSESGEEPDVKYTIKIYVERN